MRRKIMACYLLILIFINTVACTKNNSKETQEEVAPTFTYTAQGNPYNLFDCDDEYMYFYDYDKNGTAYFYKVKNEEGAIPVKLAKAAVDKKGRSYIDCGLVQKGEYIYCKDKEGITQIHKETGKKKVVSEDSWPVNENRVIYCSGEYFIRSQGDISLEEQNNEIVEEKTLSEGDTLQLPPQSIYSNGVLYQARKRLPDYNGDGDYVLYKDGQEILTFQGHYMVTHESIYYTTYDPENTTLKVFKANLNGKEENEVYSVALKRGPINEKAGEKNILNYGQYFKFLNYDMENIYFSVAHDNEDSSDSTYSRTTAAYQMPKSGGELKKIPASPYNVITVMNGWIYYPSYYYKPGYKRKVTNDKAKSALEAN